MARLSSHALSFVLIGAGAAAWAVASRPLGDDADLRMPSNPLGVKRSPYGEVFAMAMQGPIDTYWHSGEECEDEHCSNPAHHHHHEGEEAGAEDHAETKPQSLAERFNGLLDEIGEAAQDRTNPKEASPAQKFAIRRAIEDKLRFAYELDPSHYGNYNVYHLFLTEPQIGTRAQLTPASIKLAQETITYCLQRTDDPGPSLTAASACQNELLLMFEAPEQHPTATMRQVLGVMDHCLNMHQTIVNTWRQTGDWARLSPDRQNEIEDRFHLTVKLRDASEATILRLEGKPATSQAFN